MFYNKRYLSSSSLFLPLYISSPSSGGGGLRRGRIEKIF